jgi:phytoene synthase
MKMDKIGMGYKEAARITEKRARTFFFATHILPKKERQAIYAIYAVCRVLDAKDDADIRALTLSLKREIDLCYSERELHDPLFIAFRDTITAYNIPKIYFEEIIEGLMMDMNKTRYKDFEELYLYCYRVGGIVGLIMNHILGGDKSGEKFAEKLGVALQLTNILRDIREDWSRGRVYLPQDEMASMNVSESSLAKWHSDNNFKELIKFQISRARKYYRGSDGGISMFHDKKSRIAVQLLSSAYEALLDDIEKHGCNVFSRRAYVPFFRKLWVLISVHVKLGFPIHF